MDDCSRRLRSSPAFDLCEAGKVRSIKSLLAVILLFWTSAGAVGQQPPALTQFDGVVAFTGYPNGMLFHTAFHGGKSTRFVLIKTIAANASLAEDFGLTASQITAIQKLRPVETAQSNDSVDELSVDPEIYSMLTEQQMDSLTYLSLRFDGMPGLTHKSTAERVGISQDTFEGMRQIVARNRDTIVLPNFRVRFATNRSDDQKSRDADFDTRLIVMTNFQLVAKLTDAERKKLVEFFETKAVDGLARRIEALAPLPDGLIHLH
jgi:hypothetical protein